MIAALAAAVLCAATPVHGEPLPQSGSLAQLKWVQATPHRAGIVGMLWSYDERLVDPGRPTFALWTHGTSPEGWNTKILWIIRHPNLDGRITVKGRRLGGTETFTQRFYSVGDAGPHPAVGVEYASIVVVPSPGCWRLDVSSGAAKGTLIVKAVAA